MGDPINGRYKAFLLVGVAYFVTAVLAPLFVLMSNGASWTMPLKGVSYSFIAGVVGAIGAFGVLLAFGAGGKPAYVMSIIFAGAPIVNAFIAMALHTPDGGWAAIPKPFWVGIGLAALGGMLVTFYKPDPPKAKAKAASAVSSPAESGQTVSSDASSPIAIDTSAYKIARRD